MRRPPTRILFFWALAACASPHLGQTDAAPRDFSGIDLRGADLALPQGNCNPGFHPCGSTCIPNPQCCTPSECAQPPNSTATCSGGVCGVNCNAGFKPCNNTCIGNSLCCVAGDCPLPAHAASVSCNGSGMCVAGTCQPGWYTVDPAFANACACQDGGVGQTCTAPKDIGQLTLGAVVSAGGNLPAAGLINWFSITFTGNGALNYHPHVTLATNPGSQFRFDVVADCANAPQSCGTETGTTANGVTDWEVSQTGGAPGGMTFTPAPNVGTGGTVKVRVFRPTGTPTCDSYSLTISN